jgi:hypothetical protein
MVRTDVLLAAIASVLACIAVLALVAMLRRWRASRRARRRAARAGAGERDAVALLEAGGYRIVVAQARRTWAPIVDGEPHAIVLRADYLVERDGERLVAEVKTGEVAPSLDAAATRRQLLEYRVAFAADAVLLVCPERGEIHRIEFPILRQSR